MVAGVLCESEELPCDALVLAPGHSARDTYRLLYDSGILLESKAFAVGLRVEHPANLINRIQRNGHPQLFAMFLCDTIGVPANAAVAQLYAKSMAHEFGHILNLGHRVEGPDASTATGLVANGIFFDGITHPPQENVMFWQGVQPICQDFDILQARAVINSPLVPPNSTMRRRIGS